MENIHYVYGLYSTRHQKKTYPNKIKYIGRTSNPTTRLSSHISNAQMGQLSPLCEWIRLEISKGGEIKMTLLHQCDSTEIILQEKLFIESNKSRNLLNIDHNELRSPHYLSKKIKELNLWNIELIQKIKYLEQYIIDSGLELPYKRE